MQEQAGFGFALFQRRGGSRNHARFGNRKRRLLGRSHVLLEKTIIQLTVCRRRTFEQVSLGPDC